MLEPDEHLSADCSHLDGHHALRGVYASWGHLCSGDCWLTTWHLITLTTARMMLIIESVQNTVMHLSSVRV